MTDTPAPLVLAAPDSFQVSAAVPPAPSATPSSATGENLVPVTGSRPVLDPGDASPLGHPTGADLALVPPGAVIEGEA